jgi:hypothetical protein
MMLLPLMQHHVEPQQGCRSPGDSSPPSQGHYHNSL